MEREIPLFTLDGVKDAEISTHYITTADKLGLSAMRFKRNSSDDVVILLHGLTTSTDMFIMPEHYNLVNYLHDNGYGDVWSFDFRMSLKFNYNLSKHRYTLDDVALFDHPAMIQKVREISGAKRIHIMAQCLGSATFSLALFAKTVDGISSMVANSIALTPRVPKWSEVKLRFAPFIMEQVLNFEYVNPNWYKDKGFSIGKLLSKGVDLFHPENNNPACHMISLMWGAGRPALYRQENLHPTTHARIGDLFGGTGVNYYRHVRKAVAANNTFIKYDPDNAKYDALPNNYFQYAREIETPVLFATGDDNRVFTDSNIECFNRLEKIVPGRHELKIFPNYGHMDPFTGKDASRDTFPHFLAFLKKHSTGKKKAEAA